ncbi:MAG: hypothetical protein Q8S26_01680, partial [Azonexus sp.]|nr:hypothetical protein [Azonexus sp.]
YAGAGYGGSCFPKDVKALIKTAAVDAGIELKVLNAVEAANDAQKHVLGNKVKAHFGPDIVENLLIDVDEVRSLVKLYMYAKDCSSPAATPARNHRRHGKAWRRSGCGPLASQGIPEDLGEAHGGFSANAATPGSR